MPSFNSLIDQPNPFLGLSKGYSNNKLGFHGNNYDSLIGYPSIEIGARFSSNMGVVPDNANANALGNQDPPSLDLLK
jgi:hypothetical protein